MADDDNTADAVDRAHDLAGLRLEAVLMRLEPMIVRIDATLPHLATKAELTTGLAAGERAMSDLRNEIADLRGELRTGLASKPSHAYLWGVMAAMVGGQAVILAALAALPVIRTLVP
jgi:hypothetical protein